MTRAALPEGTGRDDNKRLRLPVLIDKEGEEFRGRINQGEAIEGVSQEAAATQEAAGLVVVLTREQCGGHGSCGRGEGVEQGAAAEGCGGAPAAERP